MKAQIWTRDITQRREVSALNAYEKTRSAVTETTAHKIVHDANSWCYLNIYMAYTVKL